MDSVANAPIAVIVVMLSLNVSALGDLPRRILRL
jgi:hypothetical protein